MSENKYSVLTSEDIIEFHNHVKEFKESQTQKRLQKQKHREDTFEAIYDAAGVGRSAASKMSGGEISYSVLEPLDKYIGKNFLEGLLLRRYAKNLQIKSENEKAELERVTETGL